jgi:hypothetical protein
VNKYLVFFIRFIVIILWITLIYLAINKVFLGILMLLGLILLHSFEVIKIGIPFGKQKQISKIYAILMTFIFGITWFKMYIENPSK